MLVKDIALIGPADVKGKLGSIVLRGADPGRPIENVVFENVTRNGQKATSTSAEIEVSGTVKGIEWR